jgi:hypothetical protein
MTMFRSTLRRVAAGLVVLPLVLGATSAYADGGQTTSYYGGADTIRQFEFASPVRTEATHSEAVALGDDGNGVTTFGLVGGARVIVPATPSQPATLEETYRGDSAGSAGEPAAQ